MSDDVSQLRPLTAEETALVDAHPLPDGVPDAVVNKYQLAHALDVSQTTLDKWIREPDGAPVESKGTNGRSYSFRLSVCFAWAMKRRADDQAERHAAEGAAQQLRLALIGDDSAAADKAHLTPKEQRELLELEHAYMIAARDRGELMRADDVARMFEDVFAVIRDGLDALPDRIGRELSLTGAQIEAVQRVTDDVQRGAQREVGELIGHDGDPAD